MYELAEQNTLSEKTKVPISWFAGAAIAFFSLVTAAGVILVWGGRTEARGEFHEKRLSAVEGQQQRYNEDVSQIRADVAVIKAIVERLPKQP